MKIINKTILICIIVMILFLAGCANQKMGLSGNKDKTGDPKSRIVNPTIEQALITQVESGRLVAVYKREVIKTGNRDVENFIIIKNAYDKVEDFVIEPCSGCTMINELKIEAKGHHAFAFDVSGVGEKEITVKDNMNNYYGKVVFKVIRK